MARRATVRVAIGSTAMWLASALAFAGPPRDGAAPSPRWTAATPDAMLEHAFARTRGDGPAALAGVVEAYALAERSSPGRARAGLLANADGAASPAVADQARWVAAALDPDPAARPAGLVRHLAVLGPFQDTGGGLDRREGPELPGQKWGDRDASYRWGAYDVRWRELPEAFVSARGVPLDLVVSPRRESCTWLASKVTVPDAQPVRVFVAGAGSLRVTWDGADAGRSDEVHPRLLLDRVGARVQATAGDHLLAVKACSGALDDSGRVRVRLANDAGAPLDLPSSASFSLTPAAPPAKSITPLPTALAAALDVGKAPDAARLLAAAVVRSQGGADDLRSPRAPGMLDAVVHAKALSPDELAMAGWVAPFGASRSGWLNLAVERALSAGDGETASFAERRIVASRQSAHLADWALAGLAREPLASESDAEARLLRSLVQAELGLDASRRRALDDALAIAREQGDKTTVAAWEHVSALSAGFDRKLWAETRDRLAKLVPEARDAERVAAMDARDAAAVKGAVEDAMASGSPTSAEAVVALARALAGAGLHDDARQLYLRSTELAPNHAGAWHGVAEERFAAGDAKGGDAALRRARELEPGEIALKAELAWRARKAGDGAEDRSADLRFLVPASSFLQRKAENPAKKGEVAERQLHWTRAVTLHDDRRVSELIHYTREIVVEPRTQEELYEAIPAELDDTEILRARVHRAAGGVAFAEEQKSDGGRPTIRWPDLKTGDVVEVAVRSWTRGPVGRRGDPPFYFVDYAGAIATRPLLYNEVVVDSPADHPLAVDVIGGKPDRETDETKDGRRLRRMIWDAPPNVADEPLAPRPSESVPLIVGSTFAGWDEFRAWYQAAVAGFTEPDDEVRRLAAELTRGKATREQKLKALFDFVADDVRYVNYVSGEWWLPNRPQQLLAKRQGDCDDKAILLITLLKAVGIDATEVLVQTRMTAQPSALASTRVAVPMFDHGIAFLPDPAGGPGTWLDATSPQSRLGPLPAMDARARALFASDGPAEIVTTPAGSPADHGVDGKWTLRLDASGAGELLADERHTGDHAFVLRTVLGEKQARAPWIEQNLLSGWFSGIEVTGGVAFDGELEAGRARVRFGARSLAMARREGRELVVPLSPTSTFTSQLAPLTKRTLPVVLPPQLAPSHQTRELRIVAPAGFSLGELAPSGVEDGGEFGKALLEVKKDPSDPRAAIVRRSLTFDMSTIPVAKYEAWRAWLQRVDALLHRSVRFIPPAEKAAKLAASAQAVTP